MAIAIILFIGELRFYLSVVRQRVILLLVILSIYLYLGRYIQETVEFMEVDSIRGAKMRINFDLTFPSTPCAGSGVPKSLSALPSINCDTPLIPLPSFLRPQALSLDAMDASGSHQLDILHDIFKTRLDS